MSAAKHWIGTLNTNDATCIERFTATLDGLDFVAAYRCQNEIAPTTGQLHIQFYIMCNPKKTMSYLKSKIDNGMHLEVCKDPGCSWDYCGKSDTRAPGAQVYHKGERPPAKGNRCFCVACCTFMNRAFLLHLRMTDANKRLGVTKIGF